MKIILITLALTSLFFTVLGSFGVGCHGNEESCNKSKEHPAILTCKSGLWDYKEMCPENHYCDPGPPVTCKEKHANARSFDDAVSANGAPSPTTTSPAETCNGNETKCSRNKNHYKDLNAIIKCTSGTVYYQTCSPSDICDEGPPVACISRFFPSTFHYTASATYATSPNDPCASTDAATATLPGHHIYTASRIHTASHTRPASPTETDSSSDSSSDSDCSDSSSSSDSSDDEAA